MEKLLFLDKDLRQIFSDEDTFSFAKDIDGKVFRKYENRITKQFEIHDKSYFIKFHGAVGWKEIFKNLIQLKTPVIGAKREYEALNHLSLHDIPCPPVKAFGLKGLNPANSSSFLITEELYETISLEDFFLKGLHRQLSFQEKKKLITDVASLIRKMHNIGLNHRDLYLCHIHIKMKINFDNIEIFLIDLHRAQKRSAVPIRWIIKDLGGFIHSAMQFNFTERDCYRFFMIYFQCSLKEINQEHKGMIKKILRRAYKMYLKPELQASSLYSLKKPLEEHHFSKYFENSRSYLIRKDQEQQTEELLKFIDDEIYLIESGEVIKNEKGHLVVRVKTPNYDFYVKKYRIKNLLHGFSRLFKSTRASNAWKATLWFNAVGIKTAKPIFLCEERGILGAKTSYFVTESIRGKRLDKALNESKDNDLIVNSIDAFFKRMDWLDLKHGDAKTSNFFIDKSLVAFDLDSANKIDINSFLTNTLSRDKKRILKSLKGYNEVYLKLSKRFHRS